MRGRTSAQLWCVLGTASILVSHLWCKLFIDIAVIVYRFRLAPFYVNKNTTDFICSTPGYGGMTTCDDVPPFRLNGVECNETLESLFGLDLWNYTSDIPFNASSSCINWNAYYSQCRPGSANPFQGSISFDNIFLAWIAIFQVMRRLL